MSVWVWIAVGGLGGAGALARFVLDALISTRRRGVFPLGTFVVNISGAFVLGVLTGLDLPGETLLLAGTATIGAYTTFSTWVLETHRLAEDGETGTAVLNVVLSITVGVGAAALGRWVGGH
jgi:CrcB protein